MVTLKVQTTQNPLLRDVPCMTTQANQLARIVFLHDLDENRDCQIFHHLIQPNKFCLEMDYRNLSFNAVAALYEDVMQHIQPCIVIGHGLGAYWALKLSCRHDTPLLLANPMLSPQFRADYANITNAELDSATHKTIYVEINKNNTTQTSDRMHLAQCSNLIQYVGQSHGVTLVQALNQQLQHLLRATRNN